MGKIWDFVATGGDWKDYKQVRTMKAGEELMKTLKQKELLTSAPVQQQNVKPSNVQTNKCSKCKTGYMVVTISNGLGKTIFKSFCPVCGHTIKKIV